MSASVPPTGVTVAVGGSANRSLPFATDLAARWGVPLSTVHVDAPPQASDLATGEASMAQSIVDQVAVGDLLVVESSNADPWRSRHSVAEHVIDAFAGTAIGLGPHADSQRSPGPVVVGLDGSSGAEQALPMADALAGALARPMLLARVVADDLHGDEETEIAAADEYLDGLCSAADAESATIVIVSNDPVHALVELAADREASAVVVASRGDRHHARASMSRTAAGLIGRAPCPVMVTQT